MARRDAGVDARSIRDNGAASAGTEGGMFDDATTAAAATYAGDEEEEDDRTTTKAASKAAEATACAEEVEESDGEAAIGDGGVAAIDDGDDGDRVRFVNRRRLLVLVVLLCEHCIDSQSRSILADCFFRATISLDRATVVHVCGIDATTGGRGADILLSGRRV